MNNLKFTNLQDITNIVNVKLKTIDGSEIVFQVSKEDCGDVAKQLLNIVDGAE